MVYECLQSLVGHRVDLKVHHSRVIFVKLRMPIQAGFLTPVDAHNNLCFLAPFLANASHLGPENFFW